MEQPAANSAISSPAPTAECIVVCDRSLHDVPALQRLLERQLMQAAGARFLSTTSSCGRAVALLWVEPSPQGDVTHAQHYVPDNALVPIIQLGFSHTADSISSATAADGCSQLPSTTKVITDVANAHRLSLNYDNSGTVGLRALGATSDRWALLRMPPSMAASDALSPFLLDLADALAGSDRVACNWTLDTAPTAPFLGCALPCVQLLLSLAPHSEDASVHLEQRGWPLCFTVSSPVSAYWTLQMLHRGDWLREEPWLSAWPAKKYAPDVVVTGVRHQRSGDFERSLIYRAGPVPLSNASAERCCNCGGELTSLLCSSCQPIDRDAAGHTVRRTRAFDRKERRLPSPDAFCVQAGDVRLAARLLPLCTERGALLELAALYGHEALVELMLELWGTEVLCGPPFIATPVHKGGPLCIATPAHKVAQDAGFSKLATVLEAAHARHLERQKPPPKPTAEVPEPGALPAGGEDLWRVLPHISASEFATAEPKKPDPEKVLLAELDRLTDAADVGSDTWRTLLARFPQALHCAIDGGRIAAVAPLLKAGASPEHTSTSSTPLQLALRNARAAQAIPLLVSAGANVHRISREGSTPLLEACALGCSAAVAALIEAGAKLNVTDRNTEPPPLVAAHKGRTEVLRVLTRAGADVNATDMWHKLAPLHVASRGGFSEAVGVLLEAGANVNQMSKHGTPLVLAMNFGHAEVTERLIAAGARVNEPYDGRMPLHRACRKGRRQLVEVLVRAGAQLNVQSEEGYSELHYAASNEAATEFLLGAGSDPLLVAKDGTTALYAAAASGALGVVERLLRAGADTNVHCGRSLHTPLHAAARRGHVLVVEALLAAGASAFAADAAANTPLHLAVENFDTSRVLLRAGAPLDAQNAEGSTPLHLAAKGNAARVVDMLLSAGAHPGLRDGERKIPGDVAVRLTMCHRLQEAAEAAGTAHPRKIP